MRYTRRGLKIAAGYILNKVHAFRCVSIVLERKLSMSGKKILKPGRNCWRIRKADRVAFLIDGVNYFQTLGRCLPEAKHQVMILSWDIYSRLRLIPPDNPEQMEQYPTLVEMLNRVAKENGARVNILSWDFSLLFVTDRELLPIYQLDFKTHKGVTLHMDDQYPIGSSHHQKVVVIDDSIAFCGGLDLTRWRWDSPEHDHQDIRRQYADGSELPVQPYHDVQMLVDGDAAVALGDLARERWYRAKGRRLSPSVRESDHWPQGLSPELQDVKVAISRTEPQFGDYAEVQEIEQLYLDSIEAAEEYIYIENQYFTSERIAEALAQRLREKDGPEIVLLLPLKTAGWLSQNSMDVMRIRLIRQLREADKQGRFAVYYPYKEDLGDMSINLHAKLMVVDDRFARVGSANLNNRSMGLDTECDLAIEVDADSNQKPGIQGFRNRLLAEHLGIETQQLETRLGEHKGLITTIESLRGEGRTLAPLEEALPPADERLLNVVQLTDPERPLTVSELLQYFVPEETVKPENRRLLKLGLGLLALIALALAWHFTPLAEWLNVDRIAATVRSWSASGMAPLLVILAFVLGGLVVMPVTLMIVVSAMVFGALPGFLYSLLGALASASLTYGLGNYLGKHSIRKLAGRRINKISKQLASRGILTMITIRIVPVAPFSIINLVAGASHIRFRDYLVGTLLGMAPGIAGVILVTNRVKASLLSPNWETIASLIVVAGVVISGAYWLSRKLMRKTGKELQNESHSSDKTTP